MSSAIAIAEPHALQQPGQLNRDQIELLKTTICKGATDDELQLFLQVCRSKGLDPFTRQIHAVKRWNQTLKREEMTIQIGIDGFRLQAERSGKYKGQDGPYWCDGKGTWSDVWPYSDFPVAAKIGVYREGWDAPLYRVAMFSEYVQLKDGKPNSMWAKMPASQLAKCCEGLALRAAFPAELSGFYVPEEMGQSEIEAPAPQRPERAPKQQPASPAPPAPAATLDRPWTTFKGMLAVFAGLREVIGDKMYYAVLKSHGLDHSNEIRDSASGIACHLELTKIADLVSSKKEADDAAAEAAQAFIDEVNPA